MRIAFDHQTFTYQSYGGISRYYACLASEYTSQGHDLKIYAGAHRNNYISDLPRGVVEGIKLTKYPIKTGRIFHCLNHGFSQMKFNSWQPEIIHETYYSSLPTFKTNALRVATVHDMIHEIFKHQFPSWDRTTEWKKKTFQRVDHIICISDNTKKDLIRLFEIDERKISVVYHGIDVRTFTKSKSGNWLNKGSYILYVGARDGYKNFSNFLKACARSKLIKNNIKIIAFGGGQLKPQEKLLIQKLGFRDEVIEQISGNDEILAGLYRNAICLVYPSIYEGFGLPPLEAMASRCPVVCSNTSSIPEVVQSAGLYFDPYDIDDIANSIELMLADSSYRSKMVRLGLENIKTFSWNKCARNTLEVYKNLL